MKTYFILALGIIAITFLVREAMNLGIDGAVFMSGTAGIGLIVAYGFKLKSQKIKRGKK